MSVLPLIAACFKGKMEVATLLMERGVDINAKDTDGHTPLSLAVIMNHTQLVAYLRTVGATGR